MYKEASEGTELFPKMNYDGALISAGTRINWKGIVKKAAVDLWNTEENNPDNASDLWADIDYRAGYRVIPSTITVTLCPVRMNMVGGKMIYISLLWIITYTLLNSNQEKTE